MTGWNRWRAALRIARRDAWQHRARSLLVIALVGLPVFVLSTVAVLYRTYQLDPPEQLTRVIGGADAWLTWYGADHIQQSPDAPWDGGTGFDGDGRPRAVPTDAQVVAQLPSGSRVIQYRSTSFGPTYYTKSGLATASAVGLDYTDPLAAGIVQQLSGRAPRIAGEADVSQTLADASGLGIGDTLRVADPARTYTIVGIARQRQAIRDETIFTLPASVPITAPADFTTPPGDFGWLASSPQPISWADVLRLDGAGFVTLSRHVFFHPPPESQQPLGSGGDSSSGADAIATVSLIAGMALLEVVLLAGPAFAVGARRRQRDLALLAAVGGTRRDLRRTVLADAIVLGAVAGVAAVVLGIATAAAGDPVLERWENHLPGPFTVPVLQLAGLVALSMITAVLAALAPAMRAARLDVVAALAGRRGTLRSSRRWPVIGAALVALGIALTAGSVATVSATTVVAGVALVELGVVCCTPMVIGLVAHLARWLPLSARIALRDAGRNRSSVSPAVAAVMAAVIGAIALSIAATSSDAHDRAMYVASLPQRDGWVSLSSHPGATQDVLAAIHKALPDTRPVVVLGYARQCGVTDSARCVDASIVNSTGAHAELPSVVIADVTSVDELFGRHQPAAVAALRAGRAVVTGTPSGTTSAQLDITSVNENAGRSRRLIIRSTRVGIDYGGPEAILAPATATRLGLATAPAGVLIPSQQTFSVTEQQRLALELEHTGTAFETDFETGFTSNASWVPLALVGAAAFVAIFAALIATALANIDSRADLVTLGAVGASPRTRRVLSMSRAAVIAGLGALIGTVAGVLPASAWVRSINASVVLPWPVLGLTVVGIPLVTALLAGLFTSTAQPPRRARNAAARSAESRTVLPGAGPASRTW